MTAQTTTTEANEVLIQQFELIQSLRKERDDLQRYCDNHGLDAIQDAMRGYLFAKGYSGNPDRVADPELQKLLDAILPPF